MSNVNRSPSSFAVFSTTTASRILDPSSLNTDTVAFGGPLAKLSSRSLLGDHSFSRSAVRLCPAARTGRPANTIELGGRSTSACRPAARTAGIHDDQRRHDLGLGLANRLLQRHVLLRRPPLHPSKTADCVTVLQPRIFSQLFSITAVARSPQFLTLAAGPGRPIAGGLDHLERPAGARMHLPVSRRTRPHMIGAVEKVENTAAARAWQRSARSELLAREAFVAKVGRPGRNLPLWQRCKDLCVGSELQNARARQSLRRGHEFLRQHRGDEPVADRDCQRDPRGRSPIAETSVSGQPRRGLQQRGLW